VSGKPSETIHASSVTLGGHALLILGPSGSGKSGLALDLMALGAGLISDDQTMLTEKSDALIASAPTALSGRIEARGIGILAATPARPTQVALVVDLGQSEPDRLPPYRKITLLGVEIDLIFGAGTPNLASAIFLYLKSGRVA
jgi:HPr kinase/phosphorylase